MIVLVAFLGVMLVGPLTALGRAFPVGPYMLPRPLSVGYSVAGVLAFASAIYGILRRKVWGKYMAIGWLLVMMAQVALDATLSFLHPKPPWRCVNN